MALIDTEELSGNSIDLDNDIPDVTEATAEPVVTEAPPDKPKVPDKYAGKSIEDIVTMHQEAEKLIGRQAQEVGEVRKLADELLKQQLYSSNKAQPSTQQEQQSETVEYDFFENPHKAVKQAVETHPDIIAAKKANLQFKQMQTQAALKQKHPDFTDVVADGGFIEWVKASPIRLSMYAQADSNFDFDSADELISTYKQIKGVQKKEAKVETTAALKQSFKAAAVDVGGTGETSQKSYRRADLIRLRMTDPARYEALQPEIMAAYAAGRVK